ncbi:MAG: hypothetical protein ACRD12_09905 [Acidimicrobiales bacterium]
MLASIHPLGERSRRQPWKLTVGAYLIGTVGAAAAVGLGLGWLGSHLHPPSAGLAVLIGGLAAIGVVLDLGPAGLTVPTIHRQVDEEWLSQYRGWVYGGGYGVQLGLGVVTVVNSFTIYLALVLALLAGSGGAGLLVGTAFGLARGATILAAADVRDPDRLHRLHRRLAAWEPASRRLAVGVQAGVAVGAVAAIAGGG